METNGPPYRRGSDQVWANRLQRDATSWIDQMRARQSGRVSLQNGRSVRMTVKRSRQAAIVNHRTTISSQLPDCCNSPQG